MAERDRYELDQPVRISTPVYALDGVTLVDPTDIQLIIRRPDGTDDTIEYNPGGIVRDSLGLFHYDYLPLTAGRYLAKWKSSGTAGADTVEFDVYDGLATLPWTPTLAALGKYVPTRTLNQAPTDPTDPTYGGTFSADTIPTAVQAEDLIGDAVTWVTGSVGTVLPAFYGLAETTAAMRAAGLVLSAWPLTEQGAPEGTAQRWLDQADAALEQLIAANGGAGGTGPGDVALGVGAYSFPDPPTYAEGWLP